MERRWLAAPLVAFALAAGSGWAQASPWDIDPAHTSVEFKVRRGIGDSESQAGPQIRFRIRYRSIRNRADAVAGNEGGCRVNRRCRNLELLEPSSSWDGPCIPDTAAGAAVGIMLG
jgi:hypothetical protein